MMQQYIFNFLFFLAIVFIQIHFGMSILPFVFLNLVLIFLIFTFFNLSPYYLSFLIFLTAVAFDSFSGFIWGTHLIILVVSFLLGCILIRFFEKSYFFSRLIMGSLIIISYFSGLLIVNSVFQKITFNSLIIKQSVLTLIGYIILNIIIERFSKVKNVLIK